MPVRLLDITTDDPGDACYKPIDISVEDYLKHEDDEEPSGKCLWISFENVLNENSILDEGQNENVVSDLCMGCKHLHIVKHQSLDNGEETGDPWETTMCLKSSMAVSGEYTKTTECNIYESKED